MSDIDKRTLTSALDMFVLIATKAVVQPIKGSRYSLVVLGALSV
ncbi:hypothetical protein RLEG12_09205 (plasmid) [Rhizobium leguminosarum bv. trifolii CB782]|nr:hypothetical protein RLEG12_09205 [Rhizobium leguminosarum bv. trifolii CB782]